MCKWLPFFPAAPAGRLGVILLQQSLDLSDQAAIEQLCFNTQWHYALNIPEESDEAKYISEKTLYSSRQRLIEKGLD
ncbi:MAG: transposase, partial [Desulfobacteraceae bacterium]|nr:transposase [Desulfobacteraceae bacterium]